MEDRAGFERILNTLDVPGSSISNPTCVGRIERRAPLAGDELAFVRRHTDRPVKVVLPGPYLLTRAMFVQEVTRTVYVTKEELARGRGPRAARGDCRAPGRRRGFHPAR